MPTATVAPFPKHQFFDNNGNPASGYHLHTFLAGTSTPTTTWSDAGMTTPNANPIVLDSAGRCNLFILPGSTLKFELALPTDTNPPTSPIWTIDGVGAVPPGTTSADVDVPGVAGATIAANDCVYLSDGSGGNTAGRWYPTDSGNTYSSTAPQVIGFATAGISTSSTGTIRRMGRLTGFTGLAAGSDYLISAAPGVITATPPANARVVARADTTSSIIIVPGEPYASATTQGVVGIGAQSFAGVKTFDAKAILSLGAQFASGTILQNLIHARSTANFTKNANTTFADVTDLAFAVEATAGYLFLFILHGRTTAAADWKFQLTGPAAPTALRFGVLPGNINTLSDASAFSTAIQEGGTDSVDKLYLIAGLLRNGVNAGTVQLQAAQQTSDATNSVIYAESEILALKLS